MVLFLLSSDKNSDGVKTKSNRKTIEDEMLHDDNIIIRWGLVHGVLVHSPYCYETERMISLQM